MFCHPYVQPADDAVAAVAGSWAVPALCKSYSWPTKQAGGGVIAIVELGGGWTASDVATYFKGIGQPVPSITDVSVDGTKNAPGHSDADFEVALDIQVAGASYFVATGKPATIRVYWAQDIAKAVERAAADVCDVCSISWGADEAAWTKAGTEAMQAAALDANAKGMVIFAAAGDNDSSDGGPNRANVDVPAACPNVVGCGGTNRTHAGVETVWQNNPGKANGEGTGGGFSRDFAMPTWQVENGAPKPPAGRGRMVPDVAANADPNSGYEIVVRGKREVVGGTSAVAPLYAGLVAALGRKLGDLAPEFWAHPSCFADITKGENGAFSARVGPDACTGLGAPIGTAIAKLITGT